MGILNVTPDQGVAGTPMTISGSHLPASTSVELTWSTANVTWVLDPEPGTVNYLGRHETKFAVVLDTVTTDAKGGFSRAPDGAAGLGRRPRHLRRHRRPGGCPRRLHHPPVKLTVSPTSGPIGTPITITYSGLGASEYEGGASLLWDNKFVGEMMANWTRGVAQVTIRAAGPLGRHLIDVGDAVDELYLNIPQSTLPYAREFTARFTVTKDDGRPAPSIDWPVDVAPTVSAVTTLKTAGLAQRRRCDGEPRVDERAGQLQCRR